MKKILQLAKILKKANRKGRNVTDEMLNLIVAFLGCGLLGLAGLKSGSFEIVLGSPASVCSVLNFSCMLFGILMTLPVLVNSLYMSDDFGILMSMPYTMPQIIAAKIISAADTFLLASIVFTLPFAVTSGIAFKMGPSYFAAAIFSAICLPIVILGLMTSFLMIVMYGIKSLRSKESIKWIGAIAAGAGSIGYLIFCQNRSGISSSAVSAFHAMSKITWLLPVNIPLDALRKGSWISGIFGTIGITLAVSAVFVLLAKTIYLPVALDMNESGTSHRVKTCSGKKALSGNSVLGAYIRKEINSVRRDPAFLMQGFLVPLFSSVFILYSMVLAPGMSDLLGIEGIDTLLPAAAWCTVVTLLLTFSSASTCAVATTAISREGSEIQFLKQVPVSMETILKAKYCTAMLIGGLGSTPIIVIGSSILIVMGKLPVWCLAYSLALNISALGFLVTCNMLHDVKKPNLTWESKAIMIRKSIGIRAVLVEFTGVVGSVGLAIGLICGEMVSEIIVPAAVCGIFLLFAGLALMMPRHLYRIGTERLAAY